MQDSLHTNADLWIEGKAVTSSAASWVNVYNPATQEVVNRVPETTADEFESAVASAKAAFPAWSRTPVPTRQRVMFKFLELIHKHKDELAHSITREQGKTVSDAHGDVFRGLEVRSRQCLPAYGALLAPMPSEQLQIVCERPGAQCDPKLLSQRR